MNEASDRSNRPAIIRFVDRVGAWTCDLVGALTVDLPPPEPFPDWDQTNLVSVVREIVRLAELQLGDLMTLAIAADQRATSQANIFAALATALLVAASSVRPSGVQLGLPLGAAIAGLGILGAALLSHYAARPVRFSLRGYSPHLLSNWPTSFIWLQRDIAKGLHKKISDNRTALARTAKLTRAAFWLAFSAIVLGLVAGVIRSA